MSSPAAANAPDEITTDRRARPGLAIRATLLAAYWLILFAATHYPAPEVVVGELVLNYDKLIHFAAYYVLTALMFSAARRAAPSIGWPTRLAIAAVAIAYGALDELTQPLANRTCHWADWVADTAGVALAVVVDRLRGGRPEG